MIIVMFWAFLAFLGDFACLNSYELGGNKGMGALAAIEGSIYSTSPYIIFNYVFFWILGDFGGAIVTTGGILSEKSQLVVKIGAFWAFLAVFGGFWGFELG